MPERTDTHLDSLLPPEMAVQAEQVGMAKVNMPPVKTLVLAGLAGAFIALGAVFYTSVTAGSTLPYGITRMIGGIAFSLGLILVVVGGAELFTGNNLIVMAWASGKVSTARVLRNWLWVYIGNMTGALFMVLLMLLSRQYLFGAGAVGVNILNIARTKCELGWVQAVSLGILCNILVCLAVWLCYSARSASVKIMCIVFPITAFIAAGFEHSIANMYFVPMGILLREYGDPAFLQSAQDYSNVTWHNFFLHNLVPVTIGNIIGGAGLVGLVYWFVYLRNNTK